MNKELADKFRVNFNSINSDELVEAMNLFAIHSENAGKCLYSGSVNVKTNLDPKNVIEFIESNTSLRKISYSFRYSQKHQKEVLSNISFKDNENTFFVNVTKAETYTLSEAGDFETDGLTFVFAFLSVNKELVDSTIRLVLDKLQVVETEKEKESFVHMLVQSEGGVYIDKFGAVKTKFAHDNYTSEVVESFGRICKELQNHSPAGRLNIIEGPPGTGKSYMVRGIIESCKECNFILLPSRIVGDIDGPSLLTVIRDSKKRNAGPIVFIIEDADECLVPREQGNMSLISSLLNISDGLLGSFLDIRIIATTNAKNVEIEKALKRPGRLCEHIEVKPLERDKANNLYKKMTGRDKDIFDKEVTLSEVYAEVKGAKYEKQEEKTELKIGFC